MSLPRAARRPPWTPPRDSESVELVAVGPFVTREVVREADGTRLVYTSRRQRKGLGPERAGAAPTHRRVVWAPRQLGWWIAVLFMIGSFCFAFAAAPGISSWLSPGTLGIVFFVGSIFFTSAGYSQYVQSINAGRAEGEKRLLFAWQPHRIDFWAAAVQSVGTLWFNVNTFAAMRSGFDTTREQNLRIWTPDFLGSICFLVASELAIMEVCHCWFSWRNRDVSWWIVVINMVGSIFFMASAIAAYVVPDTGDLLDATLANSGTFLGGLCFFWAARLLLDEMASGPDATAPT